MPAVASTITHKLDREISSLVRRSKLDRKFAPKNGDLTYAEFLSNKMLMMLVIREGVPYSLFQLIQHSTPFSEADWADYLNLSTKSLNRYKQASKSFKPIQSEKIIELAEVTKAGLDLFGDPEKFRLWLETPNYALGGLKPMELLRDSYGKEMVIGELTRLNHGIFV